MSTINVVTVTIGRNVPVHSLNASLTAPVVTQEPMSGLDWQEFQNAVSAALWTSIGSTHEAWEERHYGTAAWAGVSEESAKVSLLGYDFLSVPTLVNRLETIRGMYAQDAIAYSVGTSTLIERPNTER